MANEKLNTYQKLIRIQTELKAPKNQYNSFGKYKYRSCEDILEAVKPILLKYDASLMLSDKVVTAGERYYVEATAMFINNDTGEVISTSAQAREEDTKKGMDGSQVTGTSSSYARKYALNGMFCIDDTKDSDATNTHGVETESKASSTSSKSSDDKITKEQRNKMFEIAKGVYGDSANEKLKAIIVKYGFTSTADILVKDYAKICKELQKSA